MLMMLADGLRAAGQTDMELILKRIAARLFPARTIAIPEDPEEPCYLVQHVVVDLDWLDRMRVLISGRLRVEIYTKTGAPIRTHESTAAAWVEAPGSRAPAESALEPLFDSQHK